MPLTAEGTTPPKVDLALAHYIASRVDNGELLEDVLPAAAEEFGCCIVDRGDDNGK